jgi:hypothetical protein
VSNSLWLIVIVNVLNKNKPLLQIHQRTEDGLVKNKGKALKNKSSVVNFTKIKETTTILAKAD